MDQLFHYFTNTFNFFEFYGDFFEPGEALFELFGDLFWLWWIFSYSTGLSFGLKKILLLDFRFFTSGFSFSSYISYFCICIYFFDCLGDLPFVLISLFDLSYDIYFNSATYFYLNFCFYFLDVLLFN